MQLINWDNLVLDESVSTMARQFWDTLKLNFDSEAWFSDKYASEQYLKAKRKYFNELFVFNEPFKKKVAAWCSRVPGAVAMNKRELYEMMSANDEEKHNGYTHYQDKNGYGYGSSYEYTTNQRKEETLHMKARASNGFNSTTNATCSYVLDAGGGKAYLLFITFDSDEIKRVQVMTRNRYSKGGNAEGFDFEEVRDFRSVNPSEYRR
jgi:hypothetical protein